VSLAGGAALDEATTTGAGVGVAASGTGVGVAAGGGVLTVTVTVLAATWPAESVIVAVSVTLLPSRSAA